MNLGKGAGEPIAISAGGYFTACLTSLGQVYTFGSNGHYRMGHPENDDPMKIPKQVPGLKDITKIACGDWHMLALSNIGQCYSVGYNKAGALGLGHTSHITTFQLISGLKEIISIAAGQNISMLIDKDQKLYSAGSALLHGNISTKIQVVPTIVEALNSKGISQVSCGFVHCAAVDNQGKIYTWGSNTYFQLGHGDNVFL